MSGLFGSTNYITSVFIGILSTLAAFCGIIIFFIIMLVLIVLLSWIFEKKYDKKGGINGPDEAEIKKQVYSETDAPTGEKG